MSDPANPITKLMAVGPKTTKYTGIKFMTFTEAFAFQCSAEGRFLEMITIPGGKDECGVKLALSCQLPNGEWAK